MSVNYKYALLQSTQQIIDNQVTGGKSYEINAISTQIIEALDGTNTYEDILQIFIQKYKKSHPSQIRSNIDGFLNTLVNEYGFTLKKQNEPIHRAVEVIVYHTLYPTTVSIELTDMCNIGCRHCYGKYGGKNHTNIPLEKIDPLFNELSQLGVKIIELTGGDISIYPHIVEAVESAAKHFESIMVLTNGVYISDTLFNSIVKYKDKIFVQIDLHSLNGDYFDWFTNSKNNLPKVQANIINLINQGVKVRIACIVTPGNLHEIKDIAKWSYNNGARFFASSPVVALGRARDIQINRDLMFTETSQMEQLAEIVTEINSIYPEFTRGVVHPDKERVNCGCLTSTCSIRADGQIKMCTMDNGEYFNTGLGNCLETPFKEIYDKNSIFMEVIRNCRAPNEESSYCLDCQNRMYCSGCLVRSFIRAQELGNECKWYNAIKNKEIEKRFPI